MLIILCLNLLISAHFRKISVAGRGFFILFFLFFDSITEKEKRSLLCNCFVIYALTTPNKFGK